MPPRFLVKTVTFLFAVTELIFAFLEQHMTKVVSMSIMALCCYNVNALHLFIVVLLLASIPCGVSFLNQTFRFISIYIASLLITKMVYQTNFFPKSNENDYCTNVTITWDDWLSVLTTDLNWLGYYKLQGGESIGKMLQSYLLVLLVMTLQTVLYVRQKITRIDNGKPPNIPTVLFPHIERRHADDNVKSCIQFLFNYGFYKFGVEVSLIMCSLVIAFRMDIISVVYAIWLAILVPLTRQTLTLVWPFFMVSLIISILCQYLMALGVPPTACLEYPWEEYSSLKRWFFLASYTNPPDATKIIADFALFILVARQHVVFEIERKFDDLYPGGSNKPVYMDFYKPGFVNPIPDHTLYTKSLLDVFKRIFMTSLYWITLSVEFWAGVSNVNILSLGYLVGAFVFLWLGYDLCLWRIQKILKWWNVLLGYSLFVILVKTLYEIGGCVYLRYLNENACWFVQLLNLGCSSRTDRFVAQKCKINVITDMYLDAACFAFILFERRFFQSYYFLHQVDDVQAMVGLQTKGAAMIEHLRQQRELEQEARERKTLLKIKKNMNRIKAWQKKMHGLNYSEPEDHATAVRMGDYVMFEDLDELRVRFSVSSSSDSDDENKKDDDDKGHEKKLTMTEFIGTVFKKVAEEGGLALKTEKKMQKKKSVVRFSRPSTEKKRYSKAPLGSGSRRLERFSSTGPSDRSELTKQSESVYSEKLRTSRARSIWNFITTFFESVAVSIVLFLNKYSRDYRLVQRTMNEERKKSKIFREKTRSYLFTTQPYLKIPMLSSANASPASSYKEEDEPKFKKVSMSDKDIYYDKSKKLWVELVAACFYFVMSNTEFLCYLTVLIHQLMSPTLLSLPLPLLILLWGSLTAVRPTTTFWVMIIGYTEVTVVIKAFFQNWVFPWNRDVALPGMRSYHPPLLLGIHRDSKFALADLFLLLMLFLHRYKLKTLGLWKRANEEESFPPENLRIYKELEPDVETHTYESKVSSLSRNNSVTLTESTPTDYTFLSSHMARYKCSSRVMAKLDHRGNVVDVCVREMEGRVIVTHDGRRLEPTGTFLNNFSDQNIAEHVVLRVYSSRELDESKDLYCKMTLLQHFTSIRKFFIQITNRSRRVSSDFYTLMFFFDFLCFLIILFGYPSFTESQITRPQEHFYIAQNQVPLPYLVTLLTHFIVIIIDRIFYLRKHVKGKLILQIILVLVIHIWMFLVLPKVTESQFNTLILPQFYYALKCLYFLMSAYQIRVGYPVRVQGHFLTKKYYYVNYYGFKILQIIPFFNQLRTLLDYVCIPTSLTMVEWIKMESIYQVVFESKCSRRADIDYPAPRGEPCPPVSKYVPGVFAIIGVIIVMWFPLFIFAFFDTVSVANLPNAATLIVGFGSLGTIFSTVADHENIIPFTEAQFLSLQSVYKDDKKIWTFLSNFGYDDVAVFRFCTEPFEPWNFIPDAMKRLTDTVKNSTTDITVSLQWKVERKDRSQLVANPTGSRILHFNDTTTEKKGFQDIFDGTSTTLVIPQIMPKFLEINNEGEAQAISGFFLTNSSDLYRDMSLQLKTDPNTKAQWWEVKELADETRDKIKLNQIPHYDPKSIMIYTFSERNIPKMLQYLSNRGIIGLYVLFVFGVFTVLKRAMNKYSTIMFDDMPNINPVLQLCHDIYLARENLEFTLEEDLYAKLIFLFRSPETMIKWTRLPIKGIEEEVEEEEEEEEDDDEEY